jgi:hypothetical protein
MTDPVETYFQELHQIRSSGAAVNEISYYPAISKFLNEIGKQLRPRISCVMNIASQGAGLPDGGLFSQDQFRGERDASKLLRQIPSRGVIEVKGTKDNTWTTAEGSQVTTYWNRYQQVLVTNYRDFLLIGKNSRGEKANLESFRLAASEKEFWANCATPHKFAQEIGDRFSGYLKRVMLHSAPLAEPQDVAWYLASCAREARGRMESKELPALDSLRSALEDALGLKFEGAKGDHFFRLTLVQTLFYGIFSAWVLWSKRLDASNTQASFDWKLTAWTLHVPMVTELFEQFEIVFRKKIEGKLRQTRRNFAFFV